MKRFAWMFTLCVLLAGCQIPITPSAPSQVAATGEPFTLQLGQSARLSAIGLEVTFVAVLVDGRCPTGIQCAATLPVEVEIAVGSIDSIATETLRLSAHTDDAGIVIPAAPGVVTSTVHSSYTISLVAVAPYPDAQRKTARSDYRVTLLVADQVVQQSPEVKETPASSEPTEGVALGEVVELKVGESALIADEQLRLTFDKVANDSRCPADVLCAWSGVVNVQMTFAMQGREPQTFVVGGITTGQGVVTGPVMEASGPTSWWYAGFVVDLKQVIPYPAHHDQPTAPDAYRVVVVITEAEGEPPPATEEPSTTALPFPLDSDGLPIFCISELALTRLASGESTNPPSGLTPPVAAQTLIDKETADNLCVTLFGENWHMAEKSDLGIVWDDFLPDAAAYWVWDYQAAQAVQMP